MNNLLTYFIEANLYLACFYLIYQILLVRDKHFRFNRAFLLSGILLSLGLPLLSIDLSSGSTLEGYIVLPVVTITEAQTESVGFIIEWWHIIGFIYIIGVVFYMTRLFWQMAVIVRKLPILNSSREKKDGYTLVTTNGEIPTCSFFKYLFWDKSVNLSAEEKKQIFEHELAHIKQWHSVDVLTFELLRAFFWFNPVIHLMKSRITEVHEYLADHQATKQIKVEDYSKLLTLQIFRNFDFALSNNFHKSQVIKRIKMLKSTRSKSVWLNIILLIPILTLLITILSCNVAEMEDLAQGADLDRAKNSEMEFASATNEQQIEKDALTIKDEVFAVVENQPAPYEGMEDFLFYVQNNLKYPDSAKEDGIEGVVYIQFVVAKDGSLTNVKAVKGIGGGCDEEAVRIVKNSPKWKPGTQRGIAVNVRMILPITFKLG